MIHLDGSKGEGGGQILRSALTLSLLTGRGMRIDNIRAGRRRPGLMAQHLAAVEAAAAVGGTSAVGVRLGSTRLIFEPDGLRPGGYRFDIGTAGSVSLLLQTILLPLAAASRSSQLTVTGGTHVAWSPSFDYLDRHYLPTLRQVGLKARLRLERAGFYPRGGGCVQAAISPSARLLPLDLTRRGDLVSLYGLSAVAGLPASIAERQAERARQRLSGCGADVEIETAFMPAVGRGTTLLLLAEFEGGRCCCTALGERGKPAEQVADEAADALLDFLATDGAIDPYLADQLMLPLSLASGASALRTSNVTRHLVANAEVLRLFLPVAIGIEGGIGRPGTIRIEGGGWPGGR